MPDAFTRTSTFGLTPGRRNVLQPGVCPIVRLLDFRPLRAAEDMKPAVRILVAPSRRSLFCGKPCCGRQCCDQ